MASTPSESVERQPQAKIQIYPTITGVTPFWREKYEKDAKKYWDIFYKRHQDRFFKDRHYLDKEWGQYFTGAGEKVLLEVGCGAGNTIFPLLATYPDVFVHACDFSQRAVSLVQSHKEYVDTCIHAFVCDLTSDDLSNHIAPCSVDIVTMEHQAPPQEVMSCLLMQQQWLAHQIFVLSAVSPEKMAIVLLNIRKILKPNGLVLFRDYATGDLAQERFTCKDQKISENFYVRGDGTRAFYFSDEYLRCLFEEYGFATKELGLCCKQVENRSRELVMNRRWIQAVFCFTSVKNASNINPMLKESFYEGRIESEDGKHAVIVKHSTEGEVDISEGVATEMFGLSISEDEVVNLSFGYLNFKITVLSKENQHTCKSTGMMLWESARLMAYVLAENPAITLGKRVLELGSGCGGICSMIAAQNADLAVATDGEARVLDLLSQNVEANLPPILRSKLHVRQLEWGNEDHINEILKSNSKGFDIILGTDVTYVAEAILPLFSTAKSLISKCTLGRESQPALILCHVLRRVDEPSILSAASQFGFRLIDRWAGGSSTHAQTITSSWLSKITQDKIPSTALSILYFHKMD